MDCARGCTQIRYHVVSCPVERGAQWAFVPAALSDAERELIVDADLYAQGKTGDLRHALYALRTTSLWRVHDCWGCAPRRARFGVLCARDHNKLVEQLDQLPWIYDWLTQNIEPGSVVQSEARKLRVAGSPAPGNIAVWDARELLVDVLRDTAKHVRVRFKLQRSKKQQNVATMSQFLRAWLEKIEEIDDLAVFVVDAVDSIVTQARRVAPWDAKPRRLEGVPCPECEAQTLVIPPGTVDARCTNRECGYLLKEKDLDFWVHLLVQQGVTVA